MRSQVAARVHKKKTDMLPTTQAIDKSRRPDAIINSDHGFQPYAWHAMLLLLDYRQDGPEARNIPTILLMMW